MSCLLSYIYLLLVLFLCIGTAMGCICSLFRTLTTYHGSHLTPHQAARQRQQRLRQARPSRESPPPVTPEPLVSSFPAAPGRPKGAGEEEKLLPFNPSKKNKLSESGKQEEKLLVFNPVKNKKLSECSKQSTFSQSKFSTSFNKS